MDIVRKRYDINSSYPLYFFTILLLFATVFSSASEAGEIIISDWIESLKVRGDMRLRQENFFKKSQGQINRSRQRFRVRLGMEASLPHSLSVHLRLASGTGEQLSTNQSFDNLSAQKGIWIDQAFIHWQSNSAASFLAGRIQNPLWQTYSSDVVWDSDFNPEGFGQQFKLSLFGRGRVFLNTLQMVADEDSSTNADQWMFGEQLGLEVPLCAPSRFKVAGALYEWINETTTTRKNAGTFGQATTNEGNRRYASGVLQNEFRVAELTGEFFTNVMSIPVSLQGTYVRNINPIDSISPKETSGYQAGAIIGQAKEKQGVELAYFRKYVETDATVSDAADADFGDGGTNRKGNIFWIAYSPEQWIQFKLKYFDTAVINETLPPGPDNINRLQADIQIKF